MLRPANVALGLVVIFALAPLACTQDFGVFETTASGAGGAGGSSSSPSSGSISVSSSSSGPASSSSSSVSASASSSSSGGAVETDCSDGTDNNNNGKTDCADANCITLGYMCDSTTNGWTDPFALFEGDPANAPSCPSAFPKSIYTGHKDPTGQNAMCNACTCDPAMVTCSPASATFYTDALCAMAPPVTLPQTAACQMLAVGAMGAKIPTPTVMAGSCGAKGGGVMGQPPPPTWMTVGIACAENAPGASGCKGNQICSPPAPAGFAGICVLQTGDVSCPGGFPTKHVYYSGLKDTRTCSACGCGAPGAATCTVQTTAYPTSDCTGAISVDIPNDGACLGANNATVNSFKTTGTTVNTPTCPTTGGAPTGSVTADTTTATTVCCRN